MENKCKECGTEMNEICSTGKDPEFEDKGDCGVWITTTHLYQCPKCKTIEEI